MIACHYGYETDLNEMRQRFPFSITGASLRSLVHVADEIGLSSRAVRIDLDQIRRLQTPAILHWNMIHYVVLKQITKSGRAIIHDPAVGRRSLAREEFSKHFTGVALELSPAVGFQVKRGRATFRINQLWSASRGIPVAVIQVLGLTATLQMLAFVAPFQIQLVIDEAVGKADARLLPILCLAFGLIFVIQAATNALRSWTLTILGNLLGFQLVGNLLRHLLRLPVEFFEKRNIGDILSRLGSTSAIQEALMQGVAAAVLDGAMSIGLSLLLFFYSPVLALIVIGGIGISAAISMASFAFLRARSEEQMIARGTEQTYLMESIRSATIIKLLGVEADREGTWRNLYVRSLNATTRSANVQTITTFAQESVLALQIVLIVWIAGEMILLGSGFSIGMLVAFMSFRQMFADRAMSLSGQLVKFALLGLHLSRISDIVNTPVEEDDPSAGMRQFDGSIELRNVSFQYAMTGPFILKNINLRLKAGDFAAITGPSGGGKTTLLKILLGLYKPTSGEVLLDGRPPSPQDWRAWRTQMGAVMQDDRLFSGTIASNIACFDPATDMARVVTAAEIALIDKDIERMPMRYMSLVGDMGSALSGGQKQRVLLARALYRNPKILFLDEGTANLDEKTERLIVEKLRILPITRIVVAHRPLLLREASRLFEVAAGVVWERAPEVWQNRSETVDDRVLTNSNEVTR